MSILNKSIIKFIHSGDLHLGSIINATCNQNKKIENIFKNAVYCAFKNICDVAIENNVDFILFCGDVYDKESRTVKAGEFFKKQCERLNEKNIEVYVIRGNHDPIGKSQELFGLPENVHIFDSEKSEIFEVNKEEVLVARIVGESYKGRWESRKIFENYVVDDSFVYNIALLHTQLENKNNNYVPCSTKDLTKNKNINYWALGHIHKCNFINLREPVVAFSGIPQGRDVGECGLGGALLVEVDEEFNEKINYIPTSLVIWRKEIVDISEWEIKNLDDLEELLIEKCEEILAEKIEAPEGLEEVYPPSKVVKGFVVTWSICGRSDMYDNFGEDEENIVNYLTNELNNKFLNNPIFVFSDSVEINIKKRLGDEYKLKKDSFIFKELEKSIEGILKDSSSKKVFIKCFGDVFEKKYDLEDFNEEKIQLEEQDVEDILNEARDIIIEKFTEKGE